MTGLKMNKTIIVSLILAILATSCARMDEGSHEEIIPSEETPISTVISETENTSA